MKNIYIVLGMSRTGTSVVARSLRVLGVDLGNKLLVADERNPKGFYEDKDVLYRVNRGISHALAYQWLSLHSSETESLLQRDDIRAYKSYAVRLVGKRLHNRENWGFKDPCTTSLLPFWQSVFKEAGVVDNYVIVVRNPLAAACSFQAFAGGNLEAALIIWLKHMVTSVDATIGKRRVVVAYENMLQSPREQLGRLHSGLSIDKPLLPAVVDEYVDSFLDKYLCHHVADQATDSQHPAMQMLPLCLQVHRLLMRVADGAISLESAEFELEWKNIKMQYESNFLLYQYIETLQMEVKNMSRQLKHIRRGVAWKLTLPIRLIEDRLSSYRRAKKEKARINAE